ncbi:TPA: hypothetical protein HA239_01775 [Candidatus Woesearchaeota archaeon]|nr:hypothetical protein QT06_C0001G0957 [archaeon GW2011_AR15]MBS3104568.1 zf-TFIIB domain-containing protein [Candidatus Woesearchaeota archaeon]HIH41117.1 hypothetical protein [Candidatus Woesearchaeota archaeon]
MPDKKCSTCNSEMEEKSTREIGGDIYHIFYCKKCKKSVARS